jgi:CBS domain-containing protein
MLTVRDLMTRDVVTVGPATPLKEVASLLVEHDISGLPVVEDGRILGVVSEGDLLVTEEGLDPSERRPFGRIFGESESTRRQLAKIEAQTAGEAMTAPAITIAAERPIMEAAAIMTRTGVNRLPVVDGDKLVGLISRSDVVRAFARPDEEIAETVRQAVLYQTLWLDPAVFDVTVHGGNVKIKGRVQRRSTAEMIERIPLLVPGVIAVDAEIAWEVDDDPWPGA